MDSQETTGGEIMLRVCIYPEGDMLIAQGVELDIVTQATGIDMLQGRFEASLNALSAYCAEHNKEPLDVVGPAPAHFMQKWSVGDLRPSRPPIEVGGEIITPQFALCVNG